MAAWIPRDVVRVVLALALAAVGLLFMPAPPASAAERAECLTAYGQTACGYACVAAHGQVRCAEVPWGACLAAYGQVACGPAASARGPGERPWPRAQCRAARGRIACGYHCVVAYGQVRCASTPRGACRAAHGRIVCS